MNKILITDPISDNGLKILEDDNIDIIYKPDITNDELNSIIPQIHGWIIRSGTKITENYIKDAVKQTIFIADKITIGRNGRPLEIKWQINAWANINRKGHSNEFHVHPGCFWSGVYYVDDGGCSKDKSLAGEFVIMDPRGAAPSMYAPAFCFRGPGGNTLGATELVSPKNGIIMIFPAWLSHAVRPYHGEGERISISFNLSVKNF